jgi:transposase InsO family protein
MTDLSFRQADPGIEVSVKPGMAHARLYATSSERASTLPTWINHYNYRRPHGSLSHQPPATRLNNVLRNYN